MFVLFICEVLLLN